MTYAAPLPYCQPARPFAVSPPDSLISVFVAPLPSTHAEFRPLDTAGIHPDYFSTRYLDERLVVQRSGGADSYKAVTRVIRDWFSLDARLRMVGNPTILTRILSVVHAAASPDFLSGDYVFDHGVRAQPQLVPVPGGNLDTLLWLAWRYVHAFAVEGLRLSERLDADQTAWLRPRSFTISLPLPERCQVTIWPSRVIVVCPTTKSLFGLDRCPQFGHH